MLARRFAFLASGVLFLVGFACQNSDVGQSCPQLLNGVAPIVATGDAITSDTQEVVGQNVSFPCDELICVASGGTSGYCSTKCLDAVGCPDGFDCRIIQNTGTFEHTKFCAWKQCEKRQDCGSASDFCCEPLPGGNPSQEYRLCSFSKNGKCP